MRFCTLGHFDVCLHLVNWDVMIQAWAQIFKIAIKKKHSPQARVLKMRYAKEIPELHVQTVDQGVTSLTHTFEISRCSTVFRHISASVYIFK